MIKNSYLAQREERLKRAERREQLLWGIVLGSLLVIIGSFNYFLVITNAKIDFIWKLMVISGLSLFVLVFIDRRIIAGIQKPLKQCGSWLGEKILKIVLLTAYVFFVIPLGWTGQRIRKHRIFYSWDDEKSKIRPLWEKKKIAGYSREKILISVYPVYIIYFMVRNKAYIVIPLVIVLLLVAMFVFFAQTPVIAPFVYTLF